MAIVLNKSSEIGDVMIIKAEAPVVGLIALQSFADVTVGETGSRLFTKEFRYSFDGGIHFSDWILLTIPNIQAVPVVATDTFDIEYRYTRAGTDPVGELEFTEVSVTSDTSTTNVCGDAFNNSIFKKYFNCDDVGVLNWAVSVLQKCYDQGLVPKYITRGEDNKLRNDEDYVAYWLGVTTFFAFLVRFSREFENFGASVELLTEYLVQKDLFLCKTETLAALQEIRDNMFREKRRRGGTEMYESAADSGRVADGEVLRLLCWDKDTEFIFGIANQACASWYIDNESPIFQGTDGCLHLVKGYEWQADVEDLTVYPLLTPSGTVDIFTDGTREVLRITGISDTQIAGIGDTSQLAKTIVIDPSFNYEISFFVRIPILGNILSFGCFGFDINDVAVSMLNAITGATTNFFFTEQTLNQNDEYYFIRGIMYNSTEPNLSAADGLLGIGYGQHLRFNANIIKIIPYIVLDNTNGGGVSDSVYLHDIKVKPVSLGYSHAFLEQGGWADLLVKNKNGEFVDTDIERELRHKFINYNTSFITTFL